MPVAHGHSIQEYVRHDDSDYFYSVSDVGRAVSDEAIQLGCHNLDWSLESLSEHSLEHRLTNIS